jgi:aspartyl-tRNA(Asn)/glutamyl-tRNA(Gln) amidotransferase subunit A
MNNLVDLTISGAGEQIRQRKLSPVEIVQACLERIETLNPILNAFILVDGERALLEARQAEKEVGRGDWRSPLHGIPLALKDLFDTAGMRTTAGSSFFLERVPESDAAAVEKLRASGAIILGKLNMHEIALGVTNENPHFGSCANPWDPNCISGGSSGGSGAALAARMCLGSLGSDTGGSIRIPAALCGVVGLKPTYGRVSLRGVYPLSWNLDHAGPLALRVRDAAILLQHIAGFDPRDPASINTRVGDYLGSLEGGVRGMRIALAVGDFFQQADPTALEAVRTAAGVFQKLGAQVQEAELPFAHQAARTKGMMVNADAAAVHRERLADSPHGFGADVLKRLSSGAACSSMEYILARRQQQELRRSFEQFFQDYDLLLTPTVPFSAPVMGSADAVERAGQLTRFTAPFNLAGLPALSIPAGFSQEGLPLGLQIAGPAWQEAQILQAGYAYEQEFRWYEHKPEII